MCTDRKRCAKIYHWMCARTRCKPQQAFTSTTSKPQPHAASLSLLLLLLGGIHAYCCRPGLPLYKGAMQIRSHIMAYWAATSGWLSQPREAASPLPMAARPAWHQGPKRHEKG